MKPPLLATLLLLPSAALADDIELDFTWSSVDLAAEPTQRTAHHAVTFHDVQEGAQPGILVHGASGRLRIDLTVTLFPAERPEHSDQVQYDVEIWEHSTDRKGRETSELISAPRIRAMIDQPALVRQGARIPVEGPDGADFLESSLQVELRWIETEEDG